MVLSLVWSNEVKCLRDIEGYSVCQLNYLSNMVEAYRLELLNPACVHGWRCFCQEENSVTLLLLIFSSLTSVVLCITVLYIIHFSVLPEITDKLKKHNNGL